MPLMKYHIWTSGCQMNVADSQRVASSLESLGYAAVHKAEEADVIVLNTCVVRQSAEDKALGRLNSLRPLKEMRPDLVINLMGCLVGVKGNAKLEERFPFVDVFSPPSDPSPLVNHLIEADARLDQFSDTALRNALIDEETVLPIQDQGQLVSAHVPVVLGCSHACTFCIIPFRRGVERSRSIGAIAKQVRSLSEQGIREVTLLGQIVDRYGMDVPDGPTLVDLLQTIHTVEGIERIRFLTSHPNWMTDDLLDAVANLPKVCEHIEVPVQSGDDEVLGRMRRGYTADDYRRLIDRIRRRIPNAMIATDVIVGFPGETEEQFRNTYDLLAELELDVAHLARYSTRPKTVASRSMEDDISDDEKMRRFRELESLQAEIATRINAGYVGDEVEILVEGKHKNRWKGRTRTNKLVFFNSPEDQLGKLVNVNIDWAGPWSMQAHLRSFPQMENISQILLSG
jgi:tRNA-2-methylthio-N6-dimethylallyladenosine synthase